jgi:two-component system, NtrC family, sensor kinase
MPHVYVRLLVVCCLFIIAGQVSVSAQGFEEKAYLADLQPYNQLPLDSLWRYQPGNGSIGADSARWPVVNAQFLRDRAGRPLAWTGVGWFRKQWRVPTHFRNRAVALRMGHFGASEIYLDGRLIQRYGKIGKTLADEEIYLPRQPFIVQLDGRETHWITVRYANNRTNLPGYGNTFTGFRLLASPPVYREQGVGGFLPMMFSITLAFTILFGFIYGFYPARLASLFTALGLANSSCLFFAVYLLNVVNDGAILIPAAYVRDMAIGIGGAQFLLIVYVLYYGQWPRRAWLLVAWIGVVVALIVSRSPAIVIILPISGLLMVEHLRILIVGVRQQKNGFLILLVGYVLGQSLLFVAAFDLFNLFPVFTYTLGILLLLNGIIPPLTLALHLAWEFRTANRDLQHKLDQVATLSEQTIRQEQEKQHLLATQNETLELQVSERTAELNKSLTDLKITQTQLIQKEKMASLGELTAGIAHEIQNPLNFVNNFAEVSVELVSELKDELDRGDTDEAKAIANDLTQNLQKINHHGGRASAIVRGMLEHSRTGTGEKQPTNLNALADEYLKIAYHGLRAKDKDFNCDLKTTFVADLVSVAVVPQEIGRVLLNLYNNAFYAVHEKQKIALADYQPTVTVSTHRLDNQVEIRVRDNGAGIPDAIKAKIFQPFFTTKPTGEGTGLGLSLSYDIVTKGHGGTLLVESEPGLFTQFVISLPTT